LDEVLIRTDSAGTWNPLADGLGSSISLTDAAGINQTDYAYGAFGQQASSGAPNNNSAQYTGAANDGIGLQYNRARYYSSTLQRFIGEDPIEFAGGDINLYGYVGNSPTNFTDPMGTQFRSDRDRPGDKDWSDGLKKQMDSWPDPNAGRKDCGCDDGSSKTSPFLIAGTCVVAGGGPADPVTDLIAAGIILTAIVAAATAPPLPRCAGPGKVIPFPFPVRKPIPLFPPLPNKPGEICPLKEKQGMFCTYRCKDGLEFQTYTDTGDKHGNCPMAAGRP
jgi:RHS repeat-associated protein